MTNKYIDFTLKIAGGKNGIIPEGVRQDVSVKAADGIALFRFQDAKFTRAFVESQNKDGVKSIYNERSQSCVCSYPGMTKEEITKHISKRIGLLSKGEK